MSELPTGITHPTQIRNVVVVGDSGAGKTTLVEAILSATGLVLRPGRVEDGTTISDYDPIEIRQQRSINLTVAPTVFDGVKINLLDTPGYADFVGELRAGLRAVDAALFVVSANDGITGATQLLWDECAAVGMARAVIVTKLDLQRADFAETVEMCRSLLGAGVMPLYLPVFGNDGHTLTGQIGLLSQQVYDYTTGNRGCRIATGEETAAVDAHRSELIEAIVTESEDETLLDLYLGGAEIAMDVLISDLEKAVANGSFYPLIGVNPTTGLGVTEVLELISDGFPAPAEHRAIECSTPDGQPQPDITCDPEGPLLAEVIKTTSEPYIGKLSLVRVFSGTLRPDSAVHVSGHFQPDHGHIDHDVDEKVGALSSPFGKTLRPVSECIAGDIVAVAKLSRAETGDTLSDVDSPLLMQPWTMPEPLLPVAIVTHTRSDEDKLARALSRLTAEEPTLLMETKADTGQMVLWFMGEAHRDVVLDKLANRHRVAVDITDLRISLRETFAAPAAGFGRHVKQSGGHGQYGVCEITVEPLRNGEGFQFIDKVVGGTVPRQFIPSVEKGVRTQMARGVAAGYPVTDIRVTLLGGKSHSVDSSDMAFQSAGALALKDAAAKSEITFLEPVCAVTVFVPDEYMGAVMSDLSTRRGRLTGTEALGKGHSTISAEVPEIELSRYVIDLRSMTQGTSSFERRNLGYQPMPEALARTLERST